MSVVLGYRFAAIPEWVLYHDKLTGDDVRVFGVLARYGNDIRPSKQTIADKIGKSLNTVTRSLERLVEVGAVVVERRFEGDVPLPNRYHLCADEPIVGGTPPMAGGTPPPTAGGTLPPLVGGEREQDNESKGNETSLAPAPPSRLRQRSPVFDALAQACDMDPSEMTRSQARACGVAAAELAKVEATEEEIFRRAGIYRQKFPQAALTPNALKQQWAGLRAVPVPAHKPNLVERARARANGNEHIIEGTAR